MPSWLAALLTLAFIVFLYRRESVQGGHSTPALWIPVLWLLITGSQFVSQWMNLGQPMPDLYAEGSPIDALYFGTLICAGLWVLRGRALAFETLLRQNVWLALFFAYGLLSVAWSDEPYIASKRWIKTLGHPVMALVILSDPNPVEALRTVLKRVAYVLVPLSALFIKYFPEYGRSFDGWTGRGYSRGVGLTKNDLGYLCMVSGLFFWWNLLLAWRKVGGQRRWSEVALSLGFLALIAWLLIACDSATSTAGLVLGCAVMYLLGRDFVPKRHFVVLLACAALITYGLDAAFDIRGAVLELLQREPTLTDRTIVWADVLSMQDRPLIGFGYESFWFGPRLQMLWAKWWWHPNQAHNGYIETYLNLGLIGLALLAAVIISALRDIQRSFESDFDFARLRMGVLLAILAFSYTEAAFKGVHFVYTMFFIVVLSCPRPVAVPIAAMPTRAMRAPGWR